MTATTIPPTNTLSYEIRRTPVAPPLHGDWDASPWSSANTLDVASFHPKGARFRPKTQARVLYDDQGIYIHFRVEDHYLISRMIRPHSSVCADSCVEFFVSPVTTTPRDAGHALYFNIEYNAGGTVLFYKADIPARGKRAFTPVSDEWLTKVRVFHTAPRIVYPEERQPVTWRLAYFVPFALFEHYMGAPLVLNGDTPWRANFYKCADHSSNPHWASWSPIDHNEDPAFHRPQFFAPLRFGA